VSGQHHVPGPFPPWHHEPYLPGSTATTCKGTRIVQADSISDSNSESRNKNEEIIPVNRPTQTVCTDPPAPATTIRTSTVKQRTFFAPTGADSRNRSRNLNLPALPTGADSRKRGRNLNLPALYANPRPRSHIPVFDRPAGSSYRRTK
jgi:hypothetical protein